MMDESRGYWVMKYVESAGRWWADAFACILDGDLGFAVAAVERARCRERQALDLLGGESR